MKQTSSKKHERERQPWRCAFSLRQFALTGVALSLIVAGCLVMLPEKDVRNAPGGRFAATPGPGAFDARRIRWAPIPLFIGYVMMVPVIMMDKGKWRTQDGEQEGGSVKKREKMRAEGQKLDVLCGCYADFV